MTEKKLEKVLAWVNRVRTKKELGPPLKQLKKGLPGEADSCPLACSLLGDRDWIEVDGYDVAWAGKDPWDGTEHLKPPKYITDFVIQFDEGKVPELRRKR